MSAWGFAMGNGNTNLVFDEAAVHGVAGGRELGKVFLCVNLYSAVGDNDAQLTTLDFFKNFHPVQSDYVIDTLEKTGIVDSAAAFNVADIVDAYSYTHGGRGESSEVVAQADESQTVLTLDFVKARLVVTKDKVVVLDESYSVEGFDVVFTALENGL